MSIITETVDEHLSLKTAETACNRDWKNNSVNAELQSETNYTKIFRRFSLMMFQNENIPIRVIKRKQINMGDKRKLLQTKNGMKKMIEFFNVFKQFISFL